MALPKDVLRQAVARERARRAGGASVTPPEATTEHRPPSPPSPPPAPSPSAPRNRPSALLALVVVSALTGTAWYLGRTSGPIAGAPSPPPSSSPRVSPTGTSPSAGSIVAPTPSKVDPQVEEAALRGFRDSVIAANIAEIESTLDLASETSDKDQIIIKARQAGRSFDFGNHQFTRKIGRAHV